jgi:DNA-directed RNA polymerase I, II, and III subunit RPABC5
MIIPIKCFTCGYVLADKYRYYQDEVRRMKIQKGIQLDKVVYLTKEHMDKTPEGEVLDQLGLTNVCCRRHMLTHVDIE